MAETIEQTEVAGEHTSDLDHLTSHGLTAGASHISELTNSRACDSPSLLGCDLPKDQGMAALGPWSTAADSAVFKTFQQNIEVVETRLQGALRQAVKEIIEQLGKEAAARVIMAERKASVVEQEHIYTKQQALAMMLRIKHTSDSLLDDAEKRLLFERRRSQELDAKVASLQDTIKRMKADFKRSAQAGVGDVGRPGLMSPSEGVSRKRKGSSQVRPTEVKVRQPEDVFSEDECDDTDTVLASIPTKSLPPDLPPPVQGRSSKQSNPSNLLVQEHSRAAPTSKLASPASVWRNLDAGGALRALGHCEKDLGTVANCAAEQRKVVGSTMGTRSRTVQVEDVLDSSDQQNSNLGVSSQKNDQKSIHPQMDALDHGEDMDCMEDGFLGLIALQASAPTSSLQELSNGHTATGGQHDDDSRLKLGPRLEDVHSDSSTADEEEYQLQHSGAARGRRNKANHSMHQTCEEGTSHQEADPSSAVGRVSKGSEALQAMVLRRSPAGKRRRKVQPSPEKPGGSMLKEKELKMSVDMRTAESIRLPKARDGVVDALEGSLVVESSRDSRRLMQGARQLLSLRKL